MAVGTQNDDLRLSLNAERELSDLSKRATLSNDARWYSVLGSPPLRRVFEKALGLPSSFASLDVDKQLEMMKDKAKAQLGTDMLANLAEPAAMNTLLRRFLIRSDAEAYRNQFGAGSAISLMQTAVNFARSR